MLECSWKSTILEGIVRDMRVNGSARRTHIKKAQPKDRILNTERVK